MPTAVEIKTHRYYSRGRAEKLIRQGLDYAELAMGSGSRRMKTQDRVVYDFAPDGHLEVYEGQDKLQDGPMDPETLEPSWQDAVAWLESHELRNTRFWEEGHEPDRPLPTEDDFLEIVNDALADLTPEPVRVALEAELASHKRPVLVNAAQRALVTIEDRVAKFTALEAERAEAEAG